MTPDDKRKADRDAREAAELADTIERAWLTRWGSVPVTAQVIIDRLRRGNP